MKKTKKELMMKIGISSALVGLIGSIGVQTITPISVLASTNSQDNSINYNKWLGEEDVRVKNLLPLTKSSQNVSELMDEYDMTVEEREQLEYERTLADLNNKDISLLFSDRQIDLLKLEFQENYGIEDKYVPINQISILDEMYITEVNGYSGDIRIVSDQITVAEYNYFELVDSGKKAMDENINNHIDSYAVVPDTFNSLTTGGPDHLYMQVKKSGSTYNIKVKGAWSGSKSYSKKNEWYSGNTKSYYNNLRDAESDWDSMISWLGSAGIAFVTGLLEGFISAGKFDISTSAIIGALSTVVTGVSLTMAANYGVQYLWNVGQTQYYYNRL